MLVSIAESEPPRSERSSDAGVVIKRRPGQSKRLLTEAGCLMAVAGPGVVPLRRIVDDGSEVELHLEAAAGSLADVLAERGCLAEHEARSVGVKTAAALARLHEAGLVHADVKPANLLLTNDGELWVADLDATLESDGGALRRGTPGRLRADALAEPATDVISLAVTLVELTAGVVPNPASPWTCADLAALGCPPALATNLAAVLDAASPPSAREFAQMLDPGEPLRLPGPARAVRHVDPVATLDFDPVGARPDVRALPPDRSDPLVRYLIVLAVMVALVSGAVLIL